MTRVIALTGGIGTGKTTVAALFAELGALVIDADAIVHELQAGGQPMLAEIADAFGAELIGSDGELDRERLGSLVFRDPEARARLNGIVHPKVGAEMLRRLEQAHRDGVPLVLLDIPLLLEGRSQASARRSATASAAEAVILVYARRDQQLERQMRRDGATREEAEHRIDAQLDIEAKRQMADYVIDNSGDLAETRAQVRALMQKLSEPPPKAPAEAEP